MASRRRRTPPPTITSSIVSGIVGGLAGARQERRRAELAQQHAAQVAWQAQLQVRAVHQQQLLARSLSEFLALTPGQFELAVSSLLERHGFTGMRATGGPGDLAADLVGYGPDGRWVAVQCKRYGPGHKVGSPDLQKFIGMAFMEHRAAVGVFVTTSEYTKGALELASRHGHQLWLIDGQELVRMVAERPPAGSAVLQHGRRFLIGSVGPGPDAYVIWDQANGSNAGPIATYPPTEDGWTAARAQWTQWESQVQP